MTRIQIKKIEPRDIYSLQQFCAACDEAGYKNNSSLFAMKIWAKNDLQEPPLFWAAFYDDVIVSISGCHKFDNALRCLFRSATLPKYQRMLTGLSKSHMNSLPFSMILPMQIYHGLKNNYKEFIITTSDSDDASGKMQRTHKAMQLLAKQHMVEYMNDEIIYDVSQTVWKLNLLTYQTALKKFYKSKTDSWVTVNDEVLAFLNLDLNSQ